MRNALLQLMLILTFSVSSPRMAICDDQHSVQAIAQALQTPIPDAALQKARQFDDQLLRTGTYSGMKVYLITDARQTRVQTLMTRLLVTLGESPQGWVTRVLDTDPKVVNAFVDGGRYVYVYTGLLEAVRSDDELAVVVGHELGHSILQHNLRRGEDPRTVVANLAAVVARFSHGGTSAVSTAMYQSLHNGYSRDDEREADAFGTILAWRAGFDPVAGAGFFSRLQRGQDAATASEDRQLEDYKNQALAIKMRCETFRQQWASGQAARTPQNADLINQTCATYTQAANAYNAKIAERATTQLQAGTGDHPEHQERVAAIAAEADFLHRVRSFESLQPYPTTQRVLAALKEAQSPLVTSRHADVAHATQASAPPTEPSSTSAGATAYVRPSPTSDTPAGTVSASASDTKASPDYACNAAQNLCRDGASSLCSQYRQDFKRSGHVCAGVYDPSAESSCAQAKKTCATASAEECGAVRRELAREGTQCARGT
jgi:Zn-dependent protease with chaperone function